MADTTVPDITKVCTGCRAEKPATTDNFNRHPAGRLGLAPTCKLCMRAYRKTDAAKARKAALRTRPEARGKERDYEQRRWLDPEVRARKTELDKARNAKREVLDKRAAQARLRRSTPEAKAATAEFNRSPERRAWRREWQKKYFYERERRDPQFKLRLRMGTAVREALAANGGNKRKRKWEDLVGYTVADLKTHLERQFTKGMSWDNYGDWHIDHILPAVSFKYETTDDPEFRACWALSNLRPLAAPLNCSKGAKRLFLL